MNVADACKICDGDGWGQYASRAGRKIGRFVGDEFEKRAKPYLQPLFSFFGSGDYTLKANSLVDGGGSTNQAMVVASGGREVRIQFREYLGDVISAPNGAFDIRAYSINPGLATSFPWLNAIANQFDQWQPHGIVYEFKSTSSEYVSQQSLGSVIMATEYDVYDDPFTSKQGMLNSAYSSECKPSINMVHGIECAPRDTPNRIFYTRHINDSNSLNRDLTDCDIGTFYVATQGMASGSPALNLGSLYVHYDITFRKEQTHVSSAIGGNILYCMYAASTPTAYTSPSVPWSAAQGWARIQGNMEVTLAPDAARITFPTWITGGTFLLAYTIRGTSGFTRNVRHVATYTNCQVAASSYFEDLGAFVGWRGDMMLDTGAATGPQVGRVFEYIEVTGPGAVINFDTPWDFAPIAANITFQSLFIQQTNAEFAAL